MSVVIPYDSSNKILYEQAVPDDKREYKIILHLCGNRYASRFNAYTWNYYFPKFSVKVKLIDVNYNESTDYIVENYELTNYQNWNSFSYYYTPSSNYYIDSFIIESIAGSPAFSWGISIQSIRIYRATKAIFDTNYDNTYDAEFDSGGYGGGYGGGSQTRIGYDNLSITPLPWLNGTAYLAKEDSTYFPINYDITLELEIGSSLEINISNMQGIRYNDTEYGFTFNYTEPGTYPIKVETIENLSDVYTYYNHTYNTIYDSTFIIDKLTQDPLFLNANNLYIYDPTNKTIQLDVSGGNTSNPVTYSGTGVSGTEFTYVSTGEYTIVATKAGDQFYHDVSLSYTLSVVGTEDVKFNIIQIDKWSNDTSLELAEVQLWISGTNKAVNAITSVEDTTSNHNNVIDTSMATIWQADTGLNSRLFITLDACYNLIDIESLVIHIPSGSEVKFSNSRVMLMLNDMFIYSYKNQLTYGSKYRLDGPAISNVSSFATNYNDATKIPSASDISNVIVQPMVLPYKATGYLPNELIFFDQTEYKIIYDYKTEEGKPVSPRNTNTIFYFDNIHTASNILYGSSLTYEWQTYTFSFLGPTFFKTNNFKVRINVGGDTNDRKPTLLKNIQVLANNQSILQNGDFSSGFSYWNKRWTVTMSNNIVYLATPSDFIEQTFDISVVNKYNNVVSTDLPYIHEVKTMYQTDISQNNNIEYEFFNSMYFFSKLDQTDFYITNDVSYMYLENNNIVLSVSNETPTSTVTFSGENVVGNVLVNPNVGFYTITALKTDDVNYNDVSDVHTIEIMRANQSEFQITNTDTSLAYNSGDVIINTSGGTDVTDISYTGQVYIDDVFDLKFPGYNFVPTINSGAGLAEQYNRSASEDGKYAYFNYNIETAENDFQNGTYYMSSYKHTPFIGESGLVQPYSFPAYNITIKNLPPQHPSFVFDLADTDLTGIDVHGTITIELPYYLKPTSSQLSSTWVNYFPDAYEIWAYDDNDVSYVLVDISYADWETESTQWYNGNNTQEVPRIITNEQSFKKYQLVLKRNQVYYNGELHSIQRIRLHYWKLSGHVSMSLNNNILESPNVGSYTITATKDGSMNYYDISDFYTIDITKIPQTNPLTILNDVSYANTSDGLIIDLSASGGTGDGFIYYTVDGSYSVYDQGSGVYKYQIIDPSNGSYTIVATKDGDLNYLDLSTSMVIRVAEIQAPLVLDISNEFEYNAINKIINLSASGGSGDGSISYSGLNISNSQLTYTNTGTYDFTVTKAETIDYYERQESFSINIVKTTQETFEITNTVTTFDYTEQPVIINTSGGSTAGSVSFTICGEPFNGIIDHNVGVYTIIAKKEGDINYFDISDSIEITITKGTQIPLYITNSGSYEYHPTNPIEINISGGSGAGNVSYTKNGASFDGILNAPNVGSYTIVATKDGSLNYFDISDFHDIIITPAPQASFEITNTDISLAYNSGDVIINTIGGTNVTDISYTAQVYVDDVFDLKFPGYNFEFPITPSGEEEKNDSYWMFHIAKEYTQTIGISNEDYSYDITNAENDFQNGTYTISSFTKEGTGGTFQVNMINIENFFFNAKTNNYHYPYITITLPYYLQPTASQITANWYGNFPDEYEIWGYDDYDVSYLLVDISLSDWVTRSDLWYDNEGKIEYPQSIDTNKAFKKFRLYLERNNGNNYRIKNWKLSGHVSISLNHNILESPNVGSYTITATKDGSTNYYDISDSYTIDITKIPQTTPLTILNDVSYVNTSGLVIDLSANGGTGNGFIYYTVNGSNSLYDRDNGVVKYQIVDPSNGSYTVVATKDGDLNYLDLSTSMIIKIAELQEPITLTMATTHEFNIHNKAVTLTASGGSGDSVITFSGDSVIGNVLYYEDVPNLILDSNFEEPILPDNSYNYTSTLPLWTGLVVHINNSTAWGYPIPYPNGNQAISIQSIYQINQQIYLEKKNYYISFYVCGREVNDGANNVNIKLTNNTVGNIVIKNLTTEDTPYQWTYYKENFQIDTSGNYYLSFEGNPQLNKDQSTAFQNIVLKEIPETNIINEYVITATKESDNNYFERSDEFTIAIVKPDPVTFVFESFSTNLTSDISSGSTILEVNDTTGFQLGYTIVIDEGTNIEEIRKIVDFGSIVLDSPLIYDHGSGATIGTSAALNTFDISMGTQFTYNETNIISFYVIGGLGTGAVTLEPSGSITGTESTGYFYHYETIGDYSITATKAADQYYASSVTTHDFTISKSAQSSFEITNDVSYVYDPISDFFITVSGGSETGGNVSFTVNEVQYGNNIGIPNVGLYTIVATKDGSLNYFDISDSHSIEITKARQADFEITNDLSYVYSPINTIVIDVSGGTDITDVSFTLSGESFDGSLNAPNVGSYNIVAIKDGSLNYFDISDSHTIEITKARQADFEITNELSYVYSPINTIVIVVSGGSGAGYVSFTLSGESFDGSLNAPNVGLYPIVATKDGSLNYYDISDSHTIEITKAQQANFEITNDISYVYDPSGIIYITVSGGSSDGLVTFSGDSNQYFEVDRLEYPIVDSYEILAVKDGSLNYFDISDTHIINITKAEQDPIIITPKTVNYELTDGSQIILVTGGSTNNGIDVTSTSDIVTLINGNTVIYDRPTIVPLHVTKLGDNNYFDIDKEITFEVLLNVPHLKNILEKTPRELVSDPHISLQDIQPYYSIYELKNNTIAGLLDISNNGITLREMKDADFTACQIYNSRLYTLAELLKTGYRINVCHR